MHIVIKDGSVLRKGAGQINAINGPLAADIEQGLVVLLHNLVERGGGVVFVPFPQLERTYSAHPKKVRILLRHSRSPQGGLREENRTNGSLLGKIDDGIDVPAVLFQRGT